MPAATSTRNAGIVSGYLCATFPARYGVWPDQVFDVGAQADPGDQGTPAWDSALLLIEWYLFGASSSWAGVRRQKSPRENGSAETEQLVFCRVRQSAHAAVYPSPTDVPDPGRLQPGHPGNNGKTQL